MSPEDFDTERKWWIRMFTDKTRFGSGITTLENSHNCICRDREVVLAAVRHHGRNIEYASQDLRNDPEVLLMAMRTYPQAYLRADSSIQNDPVFMLQAVKENSNVLRHANEAMCDNREAVSCAVSANAWTIQYASARLRDDREILRAVFQAPSSTPDLSRSCADVRPHGMTSPTESDLLLQHAGPTVKRDREIVLQVHPKTLSPPLLVP